MEHVGFYVGDVGRLMRKRFDVAARSFGVTGSQWRVLFLLRRHPGINQGQIAEHLEVEPITTCRMIDRLEQSGLVERRRDPADRRAWLIFLTEAAQPVLAQMSVVAEEWQQQALKGLDDEEANQLKRLLDRVRNNLVEEMDDRSTAKKRDLANG